MVQKVSKMHYRKVQRHISQRLSLTGLKFSHHRINVKIGCPKYVILIVKIST